MRTLAFALTMGIVGLALIWVGNQLGWWWVATIVGCVIGITIRPAWLCLSISLITGGLGWGLPLALLALSAPVGLVASSVESVVGLSATGGTSIVVLTVVLGCVLGLVGAWIGIAGRRLAGVASNHLDFTH